MTAPNETFKIQTQPLRYNVTLLLIFALLILRLPFLGLGILILIDNPPWLGASFEISTYLLIIILIWWERDHLAEYHIDGLALWLIILFRPLNSVIIRLSSPDSPLSFQNPPSWIIFAAAIGLFAALRLNGFQFPAINRQTIRLYAIGTLAGIGLALVVAYPVALQLEPDELRVRPRLLSLLSLTLIRVPQQLGYAAVIEEPVFRGFLWGYLRLKGWKDINTWIFQAVLFMLAHIYYWNTLPFSFWLVVPLSGLTLGVLAWKTRTITPSMAAHATENAFGPWLAYIFAYFSNK